MRNTDGCLCSVGYQESQRKDTVKGERKRERWKLKTFILIGMVELIKLIMSLFRGYQRQNLYLPLKRELGDKSS